MAELQRSKRAMTEMSGALREAEERMGRANATKDGLLNHVRLLEGEVRRLQAAGGGGRGIQTWRRNGSGCMTRLCEKGPQNASSRTRCCGWSRSWYV